MSKGHVGLHPYRTESNPAERKAIDLWAEANASHLLDEESGVLAYLLGDGSRPVVPSERDKLVAATVVQWLGSPVGKHFLRKLIAGWKVGKL